MFHFFMARGTAWDHIVSDQYIHHTWFLCVTYVLHSDNKMLPSAVTKKDRKHISHLYLAITIRENIVTATRYEIANGSIATPEIRFIKLCRKIYPCALNAFLTSAPNFENPGLNPTLWHIATWEFSDQNWTFSIDFNSFLRFVFNKMKSQFIFP